MIDREKAVNGLRHCLHYGSCLDCPYDGPNCQNDVLDDALALLKEQENEYENGFNDAMLGKQELMYEGTDGKWYKKDW